MAKINSDQFRDICSGVWRDRTAVLAGRGFLTGEAALMRAVYWRMCKGGVETSISPINYSAPQSVLTYETVVGCVLELNARPHFDGAPFLKELQSRYQTEFEQDS